MFALKFENISHKNVQKLILPEYKIIYAKIQEPEKLDRNKFDTFLENWTKN